MDKSAPIQYVDLVIKYWPYLSYHYLWLFLLSYIILFAFLRYYYFHGTLPEVLRKKSFWISSVILTALLFLFWCVNEYALPLATPPSSKRFTILVTKLKPITPDAETLGNNFRSRIISAFKRKSINVETIDLEVGTTPEDEEMKRALKYGRWWGVRAHLVLYGDVSCDDKKNAIFSLRIVKTIAELPDTEIKEIPLTEPDLIKMNRIADREIGDAVTFIYGFYKYQLNDFKGAISILESVQAPIGVKYFYIGNSYIFQENPQEAIKAFQKASSLTPKVSALYNNWGFALKKLGRYNESIEKFKKAIELQPNDSDAYNNLGTSFERLGPHYYNDAINALNTCIKINPRYSLAYTNLGLIYGKQGRIDEAIDNFKKAEKINPSTPQNYGLWGVALLEQRKYEAANDKFYKATKINPKDANSYFAWGVSLAYLQNIDAAVEKFHIATQIEPKLFNDVSSVLGEIRKQSSKGIASTQIAPTK